MSAPQGEATLFENVMNQGKLYESFPSSKALIAGKADAYLPGVKDPQGSHLHFKDHSFDELCFSFSLYENPAFPLNQG